MDNEKTHKPLSVSSISDRLSTTRKTSKQSKENPSKTASLPLNVTEGVKTHREDYKFQVFYVKVVKTFKIWLYLINVFCNNNCIIILLRSHHILSHASTLLTINIKQYK